MPCTQQPPVPFLKATEHDYGVTVLHSQVMDDTWAMKFAKDSEWFNSEKPSTF